MVEVVDGAVDAAVGTGGSVVAVPASVVVGATIGAVVGLVLSGAWSFSWGEPAASAPVAPSTSRLAAMVAANAGRGVIDQSLRVTQSDWGSARSPSSSTISAR